MLCGQLLFPKNIGQKRFLSPKKLEKSFLQIYYEKKKPTNRFWPNFGHKAFGHKASFPCIKCYRELLIKWFYRLTVKESIEVSQLEK